MGIPEKKVTLIFAAISTIPCCSADTNSTDSATCEKTSIVRTQCINHTWKIQDFTKFFRSSAGSNGTVHQLGISRFPNNFGAWKLKVTGLDGVRIKIDLKANIRSSTKPAPQGTFLYPVITTGNCSKFCDDGSHLPTKLHNNGTWAATKTCLLSRETADQVNANGSFNLTVTIRLIPHGVPTVNNAGCNKSIEGGKTLEFHFGGLKTLVNQLGYVGPGYHHVVNFPMDDWTFRLYLATPLQSSIVAIIRLYWDSQPKGLTINNTQFIVGIKTAKGRELLFIPYEGAKVAATEKSEGSALLALNQGDLEQLEKKFVLIIIQRGTEHSKPKTYVCTSWTQYLQK